MKSGDKFINIALKRFLSHNRLKENFLEYLQDGQWEHVSRIFPSQGLFTYPATITKSAAGDATIDFTPDPIVGTDGEGHILEADGTQLTNVPIPNTGAKDYWFALHYAEIPSGLYLNPRTGIPEYDVWEEAIGRTATPTGVTDLGGGNIEFDVTSITDVGTIDYSGMTVTVWLNNPQTSDEAIAIETITITNPVATNLAVMTSGNGLGQATISTTLSDYTICLNGIVWEEVATGAGNPFTSDYTILGYCIGNTTTVVDSAQQTDLSGGGGHTLQNAYTGTGSGAGRTITADHQAAEIIQQNSGFLNKDIVQAGLRLTKDGDGSAFADTAKDYEVGMDIPSRAQMYAGVLQRARLIDETKNGELQKDETITFSAAGNTIAFTRGGTLDLLLPTSTPNADILVNHDLVEISGSTSDDGVYLISAVVSAQLTVTNLDGTAISFTAAHGGSALANIYRPIARLGAGGDAGNGRMSGGLRITTLGDFHYASTAAPQDIGAVDIVVPPGADDGDYIIHADRNSTDTFLLKADANVYTSSDYNYSAAQTFYRNFIGGDFNIDGAVAVVTNPTGSSVVTITSDPGANPFCSMNLNWLPEGATITEIEGIVDPDASGDPIHMFATVDTINWATGSSTLVASILAGVGYVASSGVAQQKLTGSSLGALTNNVVDNTKQYTVRFEGDGATDPTNGAVLRVRITYTCTVVVP